MGMNAYLSLPPIRGSARAQHVLGKIVVSGVTAEVRADLDWKTGRPEKAKNKHKPLVITKDLDLASPALQGALLSGATFNAVTLEFWRMPPGGGTDQNYYTIAMSGVQVIGIRLVMPNNRFAANEQLPEQEEVSLSYTSITYTFSAGGKPGGTDPGEKAQSESLDAECEMPAEAKLKQLAVDIGKDAGKAIAGEVYATFNPGGGEEKK
jgi:type VI secretion system secreted protein Hcp